MQLDRLFLLDSQVLYLSQGEYELPLVAVSLFVAVLAGVMAMQLAGAARTDARAHGRQIALLSGAFVLGSGVWSMHFIGMLAFSICSTARYDPVITLLSMLPSFAASWIALQLLARDRITRWQLIAGGISVGAGIGVMHYSGMAAIHNSVELRFEPSMFGVSILVAVALSILALWLRFGLTTQLRLGESQINILSGSVLGIAISSMHYVGMNAARFIMPAEPDPTAGSNAYLALSIAGITVLAILVTGGVNMLLRYRAMYRRMVQNEARVRTIVDTAVDGIITIDSRGIVRAFNRAAETIFGWTADEVIGRNVKMLMPEADRSQHDTYLHNYMQGGVAKIIGKGREVIGERKDGTRFPLRLAIGKAVIGTDTLFVGFVTDISDRHRMEAALRHSEQQYRSLIGNLPGVAFRCRVDADWSMLFISEGVETLTGWLPEDFTAGRQHLAGLIHPDDRAWITATVHDAIGAERSYMIEYRIIDRSGREHWVSESACAVRGAGGQVDWLDGVIIDITDNKRRSAEFEGVVDAISRSLAVIELDLEGRILHANPNFLDMTGYRLDELVGQQHAILCAADEPESPAYEQLWEALRRGTHASGDFHRIGKDGRHIWIHGSYNPIFDPDGRPYKIIKLASDLSERHAMEQELREAKAKAEQAAAAKSTFLANMSHEIRTPMNAIIGFTELLLADPASDAQRRHLDTVRTSARSLLALLNDILDTAKFERGAIELEITDFSLRDLCMQVLASLRINAQAKGLMLGLDYPERAPEFFRGDTLRIRQILTNLVGNAIKFTETGQVEVSVRLDQDVVHLTVSDTGIGIAADRIDRIFDPFAQADASMTRRFGGTGLGTTIARQLIELMHGRIWVESELGVGSQFHVELPLPIGDTVAVAEEQTPIDLPPLKLLVADDVPQNLELMQLTLSRLGHALSTVNNGEEAVSAFVGGQFDLILMDVQMPVLNGLDASRRIRRIEHETGRSPTPIVALTASVLEEDTRAARASGMDGFASKPVELHLLTREIARVLGLPVGQSVPTQPVLALNVRGSVIDWEKGRQLWGSEQRHAAAIRQFLADFGDIVHRMRAMLDKPDELAAHAHRVKGAAANLALSRVAGISDAIERTQPPQDTSAIPSLLNRLADELINVGETLGHVDGAREIAPSSPFADVDRPAALIALQKLDVALAHGELAEASLAALAETLPAADLTPLNRAIDAFDFDAARHAITALQMRYTTEGST